MSASFILSLYKKGKFCFDRKTLHCNFKGTSVTNTTTYTATPEEREMIALEMELAKKYMPNAERLNNTAAGLLWDSIGSNQVDYNTLNNQVQQQIKNANAGMQGLIGSNNTATNNANTALGKYSPQYASAANTANSALASYSPQYANAANAANNTLSSNATQYGNAANAANSQLAGLTNGVLPEQYQQNMENSIASALKNTMGNSINSLGNRGVLNSSVTNAAMNDISKNAADTVAQQYQNNINLIGNLAQQQLGNTNAALEAQSELAQQRLGNTNAALDSQANLAQQQLGNTNAALEAQQGITQQQYANTMGANEVNSGLYSNLLNSAATGIATGAAAQEAAQQPAINLWNASVGLSPSGSGALSAVAGKGTTTSTQTQSGGSGIFGGLLSGIGSGLVGLFCFTGSTKVDTPHGKIKIRDIKAGDKVISFNPVTGEDEITEVLKVSEPVLEKVYAIQTADADGNTYHVVTTKSQPFMRPDGSYITLKNIVPDQTELKGVGTVKLIAYNGKQPVYDLCVTGSGNYHNYYANGFIAQDGSELWGKE